jgi:MFS family permease
MRWHSLLLVYGFVLFFGLMQGARGPIIVALVAVLFSGGGVGAIYGTLSLAMGLGAAIGSWSSGLLYELTGSYVASFLLAIGGCLAGLSTFWLVRSLRDESMGEPSAAARRPLVAARRLGRATAMTQHHPHDPIVLGLRFA